MEPKVIKGIVKWWDDKKGYGYITVANGDDVQDYFAHYKNIITDHKFKKLKAGWVCSFIPTKSEKGYLALEIRLLVRDSKDISDLEDTRKHLTKEANNE